MVDGGCHGGWSDVRTASPSLARGWGIEDRSEQIGRRSVRDLGRRRRAGRRADDQISLGDVHTSVEQAGDDADLPRIPRGSATVKDQRPSAFSAVLVRPVDLGLVPLGPCPAVGPGGRSKRSRYGCWSQGSRLSQDACWALPGADDLSRSIPTGASTHFRCCVHGATSYRLNSFLETVTPRSIPLLLFWMTTSTARTTESEPVIGLEVFAELVDDQAHRPLVRQSIVWIRIWRWQFR